MDLQPSTSRGVVVGEDGSTIVGVVGEGGIITAVMPDRVQQMISQPIPGPSNRPFLSQPVIIPERFLVPPEELLPHQVESGIDIVNVFKLLNALQNRIALACSQHQYLRDPENQPRPPDDGLYKPQTPQAAVRDIRSLCRQQRNLMEKLRRYNCTNAGKCYDLIMSNTFSGICSNCEPFAASRMRMKQVGKEIRRKKAKAKRLSLKRLARPPKPRPEQQQQRKKAPTVLLRPPPPVPVRVLPSLSPRKRVRRIINMDQPHPDTYMTQEQFLANLGLVTHEVYQRTREESRRTERRRRTTANPKYKYSGFGDYNEKSKRSRRSDPSSLEVATASTLSSPTGAERRKAKQRRYECTVCGKKEVTLECTQCHSGFHPECIRVTASNAPEPETVTCCPNCVECNPNIRSSDCILVSRRICRPSIMGQKSDAEPRSTGSSKRTNQSRNIKRRTNAKSYSKAARRNMASTKTKKTTAFKAKAVVAKKPPLPPPKKLAQKAKKSYDKRTLNHSLAVAAAAAVPEYCTVNLTDSSSESEEELEKVASNAMRGKRKQAPTLESRKLYKSDPPTTSGVSERRRAVYARRQSTPSPQPCCSTSLLRAQETVPVRRPSPVKPLACAPSDASTCYPKKPAAKDAEAQDVVVVAPKNSPSTGGSVSPAIPGTSKHSAFATVPQVDPTNRANKAKLDPTPLAEDYATGTASVANPAASKGGKGKKAGGAKSGPVDPFCMKRTMMAMSAAAGIVFTSGGMKPPSMQNATNSAPSPVAAGPSNTKAMKAAELEEKASCSYSFEEEENEQQLDQSNHSGGAEARKKALYKYSRSINYSPDISHVPRERTVQKLSGKASEETGKALSLRTLSPDITCKSYGKGEPKTVVAVNTASDTISRGANTAAASSENSTPFRSRPLSNDTKKGVSKAFEAVNKSANAAKLSPDITCQPRENGIKKTIKPLGMIGKSLSSSSISSEKSVKKTSLAKKGTGKPLQAVQKASIPRNLSPDINVKMYTSKDVKQSVTTKPVDPITKSTANAWTCSDAKTPTQSTVRNIEKGITKSVETIFKSGNISTLSPDINPSYGITVGRDVKKVGSQEGTTPRSTESTIKGLSTGKFMSSVQDLARSNNEAAFATYSTSDENETTTFVQIAAKTQATNTPKAKAIGKPAVARKTTSPAKTKPAPKVPIPAIMAQVMKNKSLAAAKTSSIMPATSSVGTSTALTMPQCQTSISSSLTAATGSGSNAACSTQTQSKSTIISNLELLRTKVEASKKMEPLVVDEFIPQTDFIPIDKPPVTGKQPAKKQATPKAKKPPKPKPVMDAKTLQSIDETINQVVEMYSRDEEDNVDDIEDEFDFYNYRSHSPDICSPLSYRTSGGLASPGKDKKYSSTPDKLDNCLLLPTDTDYSFSLTKFTCDGDEILAESTTAPVPSTSAAALAADAKLAERPVSPANSVISTIGSSRSVKEEEEDEQKNNEEEEDSDSSDLLSIPDTYRGPSVELKYLDRPGPKLDLSALDRLAEYKRAVAAGEKVRPWAQTKRGQRR